MEILQRGLRGISCFAGPRAPKSFITTPAIITPTLPEGVKKSHLHPHPVPPPSRGRELARSKILPLPPWEGLGEGDKKGNSYTIQLMFSPNCKPLFFLFIPYDPRQSTYFLKKISMSVLMKGIRMEKNDADTSDCKEVLRNLNNDNSSLITVC